MSQGLESSCWRPTVLPPGQISMKVGEHESHIAMGRLRFLAQGLDGLKDAPRPGPAPTYSAEDRLKIVALATTQRDPDEPEAT